MCTVTFCLCVWNLFSLFQSFASHHASPYTAQLNTIGNDSTIQVHYNIHLYNSTMDTTCLTPNPLLWFLYTATRNQNASILIKEYTHMPLQSMQINTKNISVCFFGSACNARIVPHSQSPDICQSRAIATAQQSHRYETKLMLWAIKQWQCGT